MPAEPTVFVVDDDTGVWDSLKWLLGTVGLRVETFESAQDFLDRYPPGQPGCLLLDVRMPGMSGLQLQARMADTGIDVPIIFITGHGDVQMAVRAMKEGAADFIEKPFNNQAVIDAVQGIMTDVTASLAQRRRRDDSAQILEALTSREREVLDGVSACRTNKQIAGALGLSEKTIEVHRASVMRKFVAGTLAELVRKTAVLDDMSRG